MSADAARARVEHATHRLAVMVCHLDGVAIFAPVTEHARRVLEAVADAPDVVAQHEILASELPALRGALVDVVHASLMREGNA